jgi:hypothetical protein
MLACEKHTPDVREHTRRVAHRTSPSGGKEDEQHLE